MNDELVCIVQPLQPGIDACFHTEWSADLVSVSACCEASNTKTPFAYYQELTKVDKSYWSSSTTK